MWPVSRQEPLDATYEAMASVRDSYILVVYDQTEALGRNLNPVDVRDKTVQAEIIRLEGITISRAQNVNVFNHWKEQAFRE
jgi:hypothetical protein